MRVRFLYFTLPLIALIAIPAALLALGGAPPVAWANAQSILALALAGQGFFILLRTFYLFAREGEGTCSPLAPPRHLVVRGPYAYMRHPMVFAGMLILLAEVLLMPAPALIAWFGFCMLFNLFYLPWVEEPALLRRYGAEYVRYCRHVPRFCPRLKPWRPRADTPKP